MAARLRERRKEPVRRHGIFEFLSEKIISLADSAFDQTGGGRNVLLIDTVRF